MNTINPMNCPKTTSLFAIAFGIMILATMLSPLVYAEITTVVVDGQSYDVDYTGDGVSITGVDTDLDFISLILSVSVTGSPGILEITLERTFFDSIFQGSDESFIVLADGDEPNFSEIETSTQNRTLRIELPQGTEDVEIIGTVFGNTMMEPVEEEQPVEEETEIKPQTECGPGTILQDGVCILDQRCGPGTVLKNGECVLEQKTPTEVSTKGMGKELGIALIASFIIAGAIGLILALISKASKSKN